MKKNIAINVGPWCTDIDTDINIVASLVSLFRCYTCRANNWKSEKAIKCVLHACEIICLLFSDLCENHRRKSNHHRVHRVPSVSAEKLLVCFRRLRRSWWVVHFLLCLCNPQHLTVWSRVKAELYLIPEKLLLFIEDEAKTTDFLLLSKTYRAERIPSGGFWWDQTYSKKETEMVN